MLFAISAGFQPEGWISINHSATDEQLAFTENLEYQLSDYEMRHWEYTEYHSGQHTSERRQEYARGYLDDVVRRARRGLLALAEEHTLALPEAKKCAPEAKERAPEDPAAKRERKRRVLEEWFQVEPESES